MTQPEGQNDQPRQRRTEPQCPVCKQPVLAETETMPFCSTRCSQIDLGKWLSGDYIISRPIEQSDLDEE